MIYTIDYNNSTFLSDLLSTLKTLNVKILNHYNNALIHDNDNYEYYSNILVVETSKDLSSLISAAVYNSNTVLTYIDNDSNRNTDAYYDYKF